jgi:predicted dehydrogenase
MEEAIRAAGVQFMLAVPTRYGSEAQLLNQMRKDGKLGEVRKGEAGGSRYYFQRQWCKPSLPVERL